jgi:hypothetical protein
MDSTHYARPYAPSARDMRIIKRYEYLAGQVLADSSGAGRSRPGLVTRAALRQFPGFLLAASFPGTERGPVRSCVVVLIGTIPDSAVSRGRPSFWPLATQCAP